MENVKISYLKDEQGSIISPVVSIKSVFDEDNQPLVIDSGLPIGSGMDYFGTTAPVNYMFADGSAISRTEYSELFSIIGTTYGSGDGSTTFNLPDKREAVTVMKGTAYSTLGASIGSNTKTITKANLPNYTLYSAAHTHIQNAHTHNITGRFGATSGTNNATFAIGSTSNTTNYTHASGSATATNQNTTITVNSGGSDTAFNVMQKSLICNYIIKVKNSKISAISLVLSDLEGEY